MKSSEETSPKSRTKKVETQSTSWMKPLYIALAILIILAGAGYYYYTHYYTQSASYKEKLQAELLQEVNQYMTLPEGKPTVFIIEDPAKLISQQAFFKGSEKNDRLIIYSGNTNKAIIYSPSRHKIINAGPVTFDQKTSQKESAIK